MHGVRLPQKLPQEALRQVHGRRHIGEQMESGGRPTEFDGRFFETHMVPLVRKARLRQKSASSRNLTSSIKKKSKKKQAPSHSTVAEPRRASVSRSKVKRSLVRIFVEAAARDGYGAAREGQEGRRVCRRGCLHQGARADRVGRSGAARRKAHSSPSRYARRHRCLPTSASRPRMPRPARS